MKDDKIIQNAQYRKSLSIAFFNATNAAIEIVKNEDNPDKKEAIKKWRDWFLEEHKNYYAVVIANIGQNFDVSESIEKLEAAKTSEELQGVWRLLSEDERRNSDIIAEAQKLKKLYAEK